MAVLQLFTVAIAMLFGGSIGAALPMSMCDWTYTGSHSESMNYKDANGDIVKSTSYESQNHAAALSFKYDKHLVVIRGGSNIPFENFPNARMDLTNNDTIFGNIMHKGEFDWVIWKASFSMKAPSTAWILARISRHLPLHANNLMPMDTRGTNLGLQNPG